MFPRLDLFPVDLPFTWLPDNYIPHAERWWWYIWQLIEKPLAFLHKFVIHFAKVKNNTITFYALFSEPCLPFYYSLPTEDLLIFCLPIVWQGARSPRHTIEVLTTCLLQFFLFIHFVFCFILDRDFLFWPIQCAPKSLKLLKGDCVFVYLLFCCSFCHSC